MISDPIEFQTEFKVNSIEIVEETKMNFELTNSQNKTEMRKVYLRNGDFIPKVKNFFHIIYFF